MPGSPGGKEVGRLNLKVLPDTSEFLDELKAFAERVEEEVRIELKVELDDESARAELKKLQARMEAADLSVHIDTELDTAGALAHLDVLLAAMQGTADLHHVHIEAEFDGAGATAAAATTAAISTGSAAASQMGKQIALWGPLIFIAAVGIAALAPALLTILPLIAGIGLGVGAIIAGWKQLKSVFGPIVDGFKDMRKEIGDTLTVGLKPLVKEFVSGFMPVLKDGLLVGAKLMNDLLKSVLGFLSSAAGVRLIGELFAGLGPALEPLMQAAGPLLAVLVRLSIAALPGLQMMAEAIARVITNLNGFLAAKDISGTIGASMSSLGAVLAIIGNLIADLFPPLMAAAPAVIGLLKGVGETLGAIFKVLQPVFVFMSKNAQAMELVGSVLTVLIAGFAAWSAVMVVFNAVVAANPIALIVIAIAGLVAGLIYAYKHFEGFRNVVDATWAFIKSATASVVAFFQEHWKLLAAIILIPVAPIALLVALVVRYFTQIKDVIVGVFNFIASVLSTVFTFITEHWRIFAVGLLLIITGPIGALVALIVMNFNAIKAFVMMIWNAIVAFLSAILSRVVAVFSAAWAGVKMVVSAAVGVVKAIVSGAIAAVLAYVRGVSAVATFFRNAFNSAKSAVSTAITGIVDLVTGIPEKAKDALSGLGSTLTDAGKKLISGFIDGIKSKFGDVKGALGNLTGKLTSWKGPESLDKVILFDAGALVIGGFIGGLESQYGAVEKSLSGFTDGLSDMVSFDAQGALKVSAATGVLPQLDSLLSMDVGADATKLIIENWDTGVGHMRNIAADAVEGYEEATAARSNPEETP